MMMQPRIFISSVTLELGQTRQLAAQVFQRLGYSPVWQDIFGTEGGDLRQMLREKIDDCDGLLHLVGRAYGAEPPRPDPIWGRISYTQYEYLYAQQQGKKTWVIYAIDDFPLDKPLEQLDLPPDPAHPDPVAYQAERRKLQNTWRERLRGDSHLWHAVNNRTEFELKIERMRDEFAELRQSFRRWQDEVADRLQSVTGKLDAITPALHQAGAFAAGRNRTAMLGKIRADWIDGFLAQSLFEGRRIAPRFSELPNVVTRSLDWLVQRQEDKEWPLPEAVEMKSIYDRADGAVLILGPPGAGKSIQLLELTQVLLSRADADQAHPIPVIFPLSTWGTTQQPIEVWLVDELHLRYDVPSAIGQEWIDRNQVLPLLDGLDEVSASARATCVRAINSFRKSHGLLPLVVTCRTAEYEQLGEKLQLQTAVRIHPLTRDQVLAFLRELGDQGKVTLELLASHDSFWELLDSPLFLQIFILSYLDAESVNSNSPSDQDAQPAAIFQRYLNRMLRRRAASSQFHPEQTTRWLKWLAAQMTKKGLTVFHLERMQFDWLPSTRRESMLVASDCFAYGFVFLILSLTYSTMFPIQHGLVLGVFVGSMVIPGYVRTRSDVDIAPVDRVIAPPIFRTFFTAARMGMGHYLFWGALVCGPVAGVCGGLLTGLAAASNVTEGFWYFLGGIGAGLGVGIFGGMLVGLLAGLFGGMAAVIEGLRFAEIETTSIPNQGIRRSFRNALRSGLIAGIAGTLVGICILAVPVGIPWWFGAFDSAATTRSAGMLLLGTVAVGAMVATITGLPCGLYVAGKCGAAAVLRHYFLRGILCWFDNTPRTFIPFLDFAADRLLLRKVGGGYTFIHRLFRDYLAGQHGSTANADAPPSS